MLFYSDLSFHDILDAIGIGKLETNHLLWPNISQLKTDPLAHISHFYTQRILNM